MQVKQITQKVQTTMTYPVLKSHLEIGSEQTETLRCKYSKTCIELICRKL